MQDRKSVSKRRHEMHSHGTFEEDHAFGLRKMQHMLGTLEPGKLKPNPIFPQSVLGHLYMHKYGLSREQRAQIIRATNDSSRSMDVERIMRASDLEETKDDRRVQKTDVKPMQFQPNETNSKCSWPTTMSHRNCMVDYENESSETQVITVMMMKFWPQLKTMMILMMTKPLKFWKCTRSQRTNLEKHFIQGIQKESERNSKKPSAIGPCCSTESTAFRCHWIVFNCTGPFAETAVQV